LKDNLQKLKNEVASLKASNDNHVFINDKLNRALMKALHGKKGKDAARHEDVNQEPKIEIVESRHVETDA
jgi:hypothetical protein